MKNEDNLAVVVGNQTYLSGLPVNQYGASDADAVTALLTEQLGYRKENIIDLRDASLADFERVFGSDENPGGEIAGRIDTKDPGDVFIYVASHGMVREDDAKAVYLLPVDAKLEELDKTGYALQELYDNLGKTGARTTMLVTPRRLWRPRRRHRSPDAVPCPSRRPAAGSWRSRLRARRPPTHRRSLRICRWRAAWAP